MVQKDIYNLNNFFDETHLKEKSTGRSMRQTNRDRLTYRYTNTEIHRQTDRQTDILITDRESKRELVRRGDERRGKREARRRGKGGG